MQVADLPISVRSKIQKSERPSISYDGRSIGRCWLWTGAMGAGGQKYPLMTLQQRVYRVHRWVYEFFNGPVPDDLELDHICCVTACVRPDHLDPVTHAENMRRHHSKQTHCKNGHEFTPENTRMRKDRPHSRECRACGRERQRARHGWQPSR